MDWARWRHTVRRFLAVQATHVSAFVLLVVGTVGSDEKWYHQFGDIASILGQRDEAVRRQRDMLEALFENTTDCVARVEVGDDAPRIRVANSNFETVFGPVEASRGRRLPPVVAPTADADRIMHRINACEPVTDELKLETTGQQRLFQFQFVPIGDPGGAPAEGYAIYSEAAATGAEDLKFACPKRLLEQSQSLANVGAWEVSLRDGTPWNLTWTDETYRIHDLPVDAEIDLEYALDFYHPDDRERVRRAVERAIESGTPYDLEARLVTDTGAQRWVRTLAEPIRTEDGTVALRGMIQDITAWKQQAQNLRSLHDATRALLHAESEEAICKLVINITEELRQVDGVAVHLLDSEDHEFSPVAVSRGFVELCSARPSVRIGDTDSSAWRAFVDGETVAVGDRMALPWADSGDDRDEQVFTSTRVNPTETPTGLDEDVRSGLFVPVGDHAVVSVLSTADSVGSHSRQLIETLASTTEAAFGRLDSEESLREREAELQTRNDRLNRQIHLTDIIRSVNQSLVDVSSRDEIETAVCSQLVASERIAFAWVGTCDEADDTVTPQTMAGQGGEYLDTVSLSASGREPAWQTASSGSVTAVDNVVSGLRNNGGSWRRPALESGFQSVVSVPIEHDDYTYGVLSVYAAEPSSLSELEASVFDEIGATIGKAINAVQTKQALYSDNTTELTLQLTDANSLIAELSAAADCRAEFEGFSTHSSELTQLFFTVSGAEADAVSELLDEQPLAASHQLIERTENGGYFTATMTDGLVDSTLVPQAASPKSMRAVDGTLEVIVDVSPETDVRSFVDTFRAECSAVELLSRKDTERSVTTEVELVNSMLGSLTDRQRETLTTAYYSGYFEWPRESTGEDVAAMLDVSQPTVNRHLRFGQLSLLEQLFERPRSER